MDNVGKINADETRNYYLKDHLGSIRVVLNSTNTVVAAQDYDAWGYPLENRVYNSSAMRYDFTGKERDDETSYDYFGARYYDSRIGRWGQVEPLLDIYLSFSPYIYIFDNPTNIVDVDGRGPDEDIQPSETQILESGTDIMGGGITILITVKVLDAIYGKSNDEIKETQNILENEQAVITDDKVLTDPNIYSKGGKKQVWPDQYIEQKPKSYEDIDWSKGDQELADQITGKSGPRGPKTPNNEIKKWFQKHRPKNNNPVIPPDSEDKSTRATGNNRAKSVIKD